MSIKNKVKAKPGDKKPEKVKPVNFAKNKADRITFRNNQFNGTFKRFKGIYDMHTRVGVPFKLSVEKAFEALGGKVEKQK